MTTRLQRSDSSGPAAGADPDWVCRWLRAVGSHLPEATGDAMDEVDAHRWCGLARRMKWRIWLLPGRLHPVSRYFHRTSSYRSEPRAALVWGALAFALLVLLVGFVALIGFGANNVDLGKAIDSFLKPLTQPAVAVPVAFVLLTALAGCCRGARLGWLAWRPGPIAVPDFATFGEIKDTTPAQVTATFRDNLSLLRLDSASPSPAAPPETNFLDVLKAGGVSSSDVLSTLLSVVQASWPKHAFEVHGAIQQRDDPEPCGITLNAIRRPAESAGHVEVWASSWERAASKAADGVVAALLPRTRACIGPWASWRRFRLPPDLITAYQDGGTLERGRSYDEALSRYSDALTRDPGNLTIALQLGQLQEKIGLFLGALTTYQRILALDTPGREPVPRGVYSRAARRERRSAVTVAKYRQIVLLGQESVLREWLGEFADDSPSYRRQLRDCFRRELEQLSVERGDPAADAITRAVHTLIRLDPLTPLQKAQTELMPLAYQAAFELQRSLARWERRPWELPLSRRTLGLALAALRWRTEFAVGTPENSFDLVKEFDSAARWAGISPAIWFGWRPGTARRWTWQQHYTAACLYAIPLANWYDKMPAARREATAKGNLPPNEKPPRADELVRKAVDRLERAAARADNDFVATRSDWVVEEDPELRGLREFPEFKAFVAQYFPGREHATAESADPVVAAATHRRSPARVAQTGYARNLLKGVALQWHELWHQRAERKEAPDVHTLKKWWSEEKEIWTLFGEVARNWLEWETRLNLLNKANELLTLNAIPPVVACYGPDHASNAPAAQAPAHGPPAANGARPTPAVDPLSEIEEYVLQKLKPRAEQHFDQRIDLLRRVDAESLRLTTRAQHRRICRLQAGAWQTLGDWLSGGQADGQLASKYVLDRLSDATQLWARAELRLDAQSMMRRTSGRMLVRVTRVRRGRATD